MSVEECVSGRREVAIFFDRARKLRVPAESASRERERKGKSHPFMFVACLAIVDRKLPDTISK